MISSVLPFSLGLGTIAGTVLWALALYLGFSPLADRMIDGCHRWIQSLKADPPHSTRSNPSANPGYEAQMAAASLLSVFPFLALGGVAHYGLSFSLGGSWAVSLGIIAFMVSGVYELGRQSSQTE
jgi:hypothetical protein